MIRLKNLKFYQSLPVDTRQKISKLMAWPMVGWIRFGSFKRLNPISKNWGFDRGLPVDRYYIETFLYENRQDIKGNILEFKEDLYASRFGKDQVKQCDIVHPVEGNNKATIVADITRENALPGNFYDCIICTQTLPFIFDLDQAVSTLYRILKPGGVLLTAVSGISRLSRSDMENWGHYWHFTSASLAQILLKYFPENNSQIQSYGNVKSACAFLYGLSVNDLKIKDLLFKDPDYEVMITAKSIKPL